MSVREVVHIHIPRTAGSSLETHLDIPLKNAGVSLKSGHFIWGDYPPEPCRMFFTVLREPVARVASVIQYIAGNPAHRLHAEYHANGPLACMPIKGALANFQVKSLVGRHTLNRQIVASDAVRAVETLSRPDVIACTPATINDGLRRLSAAIGVEIGDLAEHRNQSSATVHSIDVLRRARELNRWDRFVWRYISCTRIRNCPSSPAVKDPSLVYRAYSGSPAARAAEPAA